MYLHLVTITMLFITKIKYFLFVLLQPFCIVVKILYKGIVRAKDAIANA